MNYYEQHIGDYAKDAGHLSMLEDGAYRRLIDAYYTRERALPVDLRECCKLARATSKAEKDAVAYVLREFFKLGADGYHQKRCDQEIERYLELEPERELKRENDKERQRRARARRAELFDQLRANGITAPWNASTHVLEAQLSRVTGRDKSHHVTRDNTATHSPYPNTHTTADQETSRTPTDPAPASTPAGRACQMLKAAGCARVNPSNPDLLAAISEGVTAEALRDTFLEAPDKSNPFAWAITTARNRHAEGPKPVSTGPPRQHANGSSSGSKVYDAIQKLQGMKTNANANHADERLVLECVAGRIEQAHDLEP